MTNTYSHAARELEILIKSSPEDDRPVIEPFREEILAICEKFGLSGQSGGSAPFVAAALCKTIKQLCLQEPICPLMGIDEEWMEVSESDEKTIFQNNRCGAIFKENKDGRPYFLDAIIWKNQNGVTYSGTALLIRKVIGEAGDFAGDSKTKITSRQFIRDFPFTPKTFYIDVEEKEITPGNFEFYIKDSAQLAKAFTYYENPLKGDQQNKS